jgi:hypothetical protein
MMRFINWASVLAITVVFPTQLGAWDLNTPPDTSPDLSLHIEQVHDAISSSDGYLVNDTAGVVSSRTGERALLPEKDDELGIGRGNPYVAVSEFFISPDNQWICRTQKFHHGMSAAYLYKRVKGLIYQKATSKPLDVLTWRFFEQKAGVKIPPSSAEGVVNFVDWAPHSLILELNPNKNLASKIEGGLVNYDLKTGKFSIPQN